MKYVTPKEASETLGISISTLRRWDKNGNIKSIKTPGGHRRFSIQEYEHKKKPTICYARVSSYSQRDDLERQAEFLLTKHPTAELVKEIGSGLNFRRPKLLSILERIYKGDIGYLICAYPDRLVRFGFPLIEWLCKQGECKLLVLNEIKVSPEQELVQDILSILHVFSSRLYGLRKYKTKVQEDLQEEYNSKADTKCSSEDTCISI